MNQLSKQLVINPLFINLFINRLIIAALTCRHLFFSAMSPPQFVRVSPSRLILHYNSNACFYSLKYLCIIEQVKVNPAQTTLSQTMKNTVFVVSALPFSVRWTNLQRLPCTHCALTLSVHSSCWTVPIRIVFNVFGNISGVNLLNPDSVFFHN